MLLRKRLRSPDALITAGMACCAIAIVAQRFVNPPTDFWQGFVAGITGVLYGVSIVFNITGLILKRQQPKSP